MPSNSPKQSHVRPIESVQLKVSIRTGRGTAVRIKGLVGSTRLLRSGCEITIEGQSPAEVATKARGVLDAVRAAVDSSERI